MLYTEKADGVMPSMDIRREPFSIAIQAKTNIIASEIARKKSEQKAAKEKEEQGKPEA